MQDVSKAVSALIAFVTQNDHHGMPRTGDEIRCLQELDAEVFALCAEAGIRLPEIPAARNQRPFGLTHIPSYGTSDGFTVVASENWLQSMRGVLAIATRLSLNQGGEVADGSFPVSSKPWEVAPDGRVNERAVASHGLHLDDILLGPRPGFGNRFPISDFDAIVVDGDTPSVCPETDRPVDTEWLPVISDVFKRVGLVKPGQTIHWVGGQAKLENVCTCFNQDSLAAPQTSIEPQPPDGESVCPAEPGSDSRAAKKSKRSTEKGEASAKLIAALTLHHKYADGSCLNLEPIGNNELARAADVSASTASVFFHEKFAGHMKYRFACRDTTLLVSALKLLNQEFSPHHLYGAKPPGEDDRDDDD
ncbi:MAG: hypothetical protein ABGZ35_00195 [Planctomycetaceae bacterium]